MMDPKEIYGEQDPLGLYPESSDEVSRARLTRVFDLLGNDLLEHAVVILLEENIVQATRIRVLEKIVQRMGELGR